MSNSFYIFAQTILLLGGNIQAYSHEQVTEQTAVLIGYYESLVQQGFFKAENLQKLAVSEELINPITQQQADVSSACFIHYEQLDGMITSQPDSFDVIMIQEWSSKKLIELGEHTATKYDVHGHTRSLYRPMKFIPIPANRYMSLLKGKEITFLDGIEIQDTPVTHYQWSLIMGYNPSQWSDSPDNDEIDCNGYSIMMSPNAPVNSVSFNNAEIFVKHMNEKNDGYLYALPSMEEFLAVLSFHKSNHDQALYDSKKLTYQNNTLRNSQNVGRGSFVELNGQRVFDLTNNVGQLTRDQYFSEVVSSLVFRPLLSCTAVERPADMIRPIYYPDTTCSSIGLRLIRVKKTNSNEASHYHSLLPMRYDVEDFVWSSDVVKDDPLWQWEHISKMLIHDEETLRLMFKESSLFDEDTRYSLEKIKESCYLTTGENALDVFGVLSTFNERNWVDLRNKGIKNIAPLQGLTHLESLRLQDNAIHDLRPLKHLTNLRYLHVQNNAIKDIQVLENMLNLTTLGISKNKITSLDSLNKLTMITHLYGEENTIEVITATQNLKALYLLNLSKNCIQDIALLAHLHEKLMHLALSYNKIADIQPLASLHKLESLMLDHNVIQEVAALRSLHNLDTLNLNANRIRDISPLSSLTQLGKLFLNDNPITVGSLKNLQHLREVYIDEHQAESFNLDEMFHPSTKVIIIPERER